MTPGTNLARAAFVVGARRALVLAVGIVPFGAVYGVAVAQSDVNDWVGGSASVLLFAGASQLSLLDLHEGGAAWLVVVGTTLAITDGVARSAALVATDVIASNGVIHVIDKVLLPNLAN